MIIKYYADVDDHDVYDCDYDCDDDYYWRLVWLTMRRVAVAATSYRRTGCDNYVHGILAMRHMSKPKSKLKPKPKTKLKLAQPQRGFCFSILFSVLSLRFVLLMI